MKISCLLKIFGLFLVFTFATYAQNQITNAENEQILFNVTVTTKKDDLITGLKAENFKVYDEKMLQPITFFSAEDVPISIGILVDKSASITETKASSVQQALTNFVNKSHPNNEYFLMAFNTTQGLLFNNFQDNTTTLQSIKKLSAVKSQGNTNFYDAVQASLEKVSKGKYTQKVLIIISDGQDNSSKSDFGKIKSLTKKSNVLLYTVNISGKTGSDTPDGIQALAFSEMLTKISGGKTYVPQTLVELNESFLRIADELRNQYVIGFKIAKPTEKDKKEKWREVEIKVELLPNSNNVGKPNVRSRKGYYLSAKSN